ncbi:MAG: hypothetical protein ACI3ZF_03155 [Candidatus Cryptobacteroides sp.]
MCFFDKLYYWRLRRQKEIDDTNSQLVYAYSEGAHNNQLETARKMKADGVPALNIIKYIGLDAETVEQL